MTQHQRDGIDYTDQAEVAEPAPVDTTEEPEPEVAEETPVDPAEPEVAPPAAEPDAGA